eukprot:5228974-Pyramimonas_sp.AAC.1
MLPASSAKPGASATTAALGAHASTALPGAATTGTTAPLRKAELGPKRGFRIPPGLKGSPSDNTESR